MARIPKQLSILLEAAQVLGLPDLDVAYAKEYLQHNELGLCLDTIIDQLYEYDIPIDNRVYKRIETIGNAMAMTADSWTFLEELLVPSESLPEAIQRKLAAIFR
jgi:hypothetical protein